MMGLGPVSGKKSGYHHKDLRNALQHVALRFIAERNGPAFSLRELGVAIGVSHTAVYRHFASKAELLEALTEEGFSELHRYQTAELAKAGSDPLMRLHALGDAYFRFAQENPGAFWLMFGNRGKNSIARRPDRTSTRKPIRSSSMRSWHASARTSSSRAIPTGSPAT
jgi:AcrR family transcriptional regulator